MMMTEKQKLPGHLCAVFCVLVWGTTFIVSRILLAYYTPTQTMLMRFIGAYLFLWLLCREWHFRLRDELAFMLMSVFSNTLYFWAENTAITLTQTSNVSILVSTAPVITALLLLFLPDGERVTKQIVVGIGVAFLGVVLVVLNGSVVLQLNPAGDLLAIGAACCWSIYGMILRKYSGRFSSYLISRKLMFYGMLTTLPILWAEHAPFEPAHLASPRLFLGLLFLTLLGSAFCYVAWNTAVDRLGVLHTTIYIYAIPFVTMVSAAICLHEVITLMGVFGTVLTVAGMLISSLHRETQN
jgi:drug/metabolite transporter (DMT)-like permease